MSRRYQSCQNLGHRSNSSSLNIAKALPTLSSRPPLPPRPNFRVETSVLADEMLGKGFQSEGTRDGVFFDYDEPRTKFSDDYDKLSSTTTYNLEGVSNRVRGRSSESTDGGTRDSRDSGIYTSPPPPDEHHTLLSQEHLMQLKQFLLTKTPDEIALTLSHEHAKMLRLLEPIYNEEKNGLRLVLLPSGSSLRHELIERCKQLRLTCLLSILCGTREDAHIILKKWILTTISLAYHGDAFACSCLAGTLSENSVSFSNTK
ncbi:hypothetical protein DICVIV_07291 [Dictyocaulus viviparus]|uniref:Uncharacterized protein n=1 Tax=Dictyocaulus viviparus TaxID=29172 RepID=A0A0D8XS59_DICVI|nr:hypothetical protein DICVIV_07291 [Dictyocaulus viviparus]